MKNMYNFAVNPKLRNLINPDIDVTGNFFFREMRFLIQPSKYYKFEPNRGGGGSLPWLVEYVWNDP